jgi:hypothetical protein
MGSLSPSASVPSSLKQELSYLPHRGLVRIKGKNGGKVLCTASFGGPSDGPQETRVCALSAYLGKCVVRSVE